MPNTATDQEIAAAKAYETLHVPALFQQWAHKVAAAASIKSGERVLDVACGTGVLARVAASHCGDDHLVAGLDAAAGMLAVAAKKSPNIKWQHGLADALPYADGTFDAVVSQFGLMFFPDRSAALSEMRRVLVPGGRFAVAVWESLDRSDAYPALVELLQSRAGEAAANALRAPFVLGDRQALKALFKQAGFESVQVETTTGIARFPSIRVMVEADLRGWLPVMGVHLEEPLIDQILVESEEILRPYVLSDGTVQFDSPAHIVTGRNTH
ncbi:MAG: ubiquinone/menaquinone biosynthesis methyltransferase [Lysobacteraceae bacterium]|nr:MAG: ubiquinone/menaquinone biosynthesis methyltransferase [Xanthomonadaceae bacterium]